MGNACWVRIIYKNVGNTTTTVKLTDLEVKWGKLHAGGRSYISWSNDDPDRSFLYSQAISTVRKAPMITIIGSLSLVKAFRSTRAVTRELCRHCRHFAHC
ncbi:hypothetical protein BC835DRAFT_1285256 [Cytidiella melzeri]|nr:hypothetical protein BC835DRAFT_1285256 [Cytidiella melzeri]